MTKWERSKYRTKDEEIRQKQIVADRQATMDSAFGSEDPDKKRKKRMEKENRARCKVYKEWAKNWKRDHDSNKQSFFQWLESNHEDFQQLRAMFQQHQQTGRTDRRAQRKVKKLYRHIALAVHPDKLPQLCKKKRVMNMMRDILTESEKMKDELTK